MANAKEPAPVTEENEMVEVEIALLRENTSDVIVSVNGKNFQIKRGVRVKVPRYVMEVLENMRKMDTLAIKRKEAAAKNFG